MKITSPEEIKREMELNLLRSQNAQLRADLDYIQIMTGVEIPTTEEVSHEE
jgi:hypothetical protein